MATVLIIDDEPAFCSVVRDYLQAVGHEVMVAGNAHHSLSLARQQPDVVVMDIRMPEISGLELLPRIKAEAAGARVIVVTAVNDYRIADLLYESGADAFLTKPVQFSVLSEQINRLAGSGAGSAA